MSALINDVEKENLEKLDKSMALPFSLLVLLVIVCYSLKLMLVFV